MNVPPEMRYTAEHEWVSTPVDSDDGSSLVRVGITDYAQDALGDVVFVGLPVQGSAVAARDMFGELESTKSVSELYAPVSGTIAAVNEVLVDNPVLINDDPYGEGWLIEIRIEAGTSLDDLLDAEAYRELTEG